MMPHLLTFAIFSPIVGIVLLLLVPKRYDEGARAVAFGSSLFTFAITSLLWIRFDAAQGFNFQEAVPWIPALNINYHVGIDGVSLLMVALTALLTPLAVLASWDEIKSKRRSFFILMLLCQIGLLGTFCALDLFLFYVFWEAMLIPMYLLIGMFGSGRRVYVALKFLLFTMLGSVTMLVGLIYLSLAAGESFNMLTLAGTALSFKTQLWLFLAFGLAFAIKVPIFPLHTWLPDAHTEAPTAGSVLLAGVFLKAGAYGFYRIAMPCFPMAVEHFRPYIFIFAVISIIYGALVSISQKDLKRLIAYSSVSHMGIVVLGLISLNQEAASGAILQMFNHGVSTGALFLVFGMIYARYHTRDISELGGVARALPVIAWIFIFSGLSSLGLPGLNNFIGEVLVLLGAFKARPEVAVISASVIIFSAVYILWAVERVFFGKEKAGAPSALKDVSVREVLLIAPLLLLMVWLGVHPSTALSRTPASIGTFLAESRENIIEPPQRNLNVMLPEIYKRGVEIILPEINELNNRIPTPEEEKYGVPVEKESEEAIEGVLKGEEETIEADSEKVIDRNEGTAPGEEDSVAPERPPEPLVVP